MKGPLCDIGAAIWEGMLIEGTLMDAVPSACAPYRLLGDHPSILNTFRRMSEDPEIRKQG